MANAYRDKTVMDILEEEKRLKEALVYMRDNGLTLNGYRLDTGRLRDVIAQIMNTTQTKIAQVESINKRLIPEFSQELKEGRLTFSAAYELSGMQAEKQMEMLKRHRETGLTWKEVKEAKAEAEEDAGKEQDTERKPQEGRELEDCEAPKKSRKKGMQELEEVDQDGEWQQAHPESIVSLCYSCQRYSECNVKTGTCQTCDRYLNKADVEKTEEQRYEEEQGAIDRQTRKTMRERQQEDVMQAFSSDRKQEKSLLVSLETYEGVRAGRVPYMIIKEGQDPYREKDILTLAVFRGGKATGHRLRVCVTCVDNAESSSGIAEGYAVIGLREISGAGQNAVSESDTAERERKQNE